MKKLFLFFTSLILFFLSIETILFFGALFYKSRFEKNLDNKIRRKKSFTILCIGESTTAGYKTSYPQFLEEYLNKNIHFKNNPKHNLKNNMVFEKYFNVINLGIPNIETSDILKNLDNNLLKYRPDMVITMIGVNDDGHKLKRKNRNIIVSMLDKTRTFNFLFGLYQNLVDKKLLKMSNLKNMKLKNSENSELKRKELKNVKLKNKENMPQNNYDALFEAACLYLENKEFNKALGLLYDCTKMEPENSQAWYELGCYFKEIEKNQARAEHCWLKAVKGDPEDENSFCELGNLYWDQNKTDLAEKFWKRALALDPANEASLNNLGKLLIETKRFEEARNYYFGALKKDPHLYIAHAGLARAAGLSKDAAGMSKDAAALHLKNAEQSRVKYYSPETAYNYRKIIAKIKNRGIIPVVMQYPLRSLVPLKSMLNNDPDLLFVSNEKSFKQAVLNGQEQDYFTDLFAGDFGHCTFKGHKMIAENAGKAILQRYF